ncbi:MAG: proprotein convertase P-domain-containing protein, partial [Saprospiraceae bacterium]|nr:proprotein convertase P-domain-containing protein [Saprospiraceae bacterium]
MTKKNFKWAIGGLFLLMILCLCGTQSIAQSFPATPNTTPVAIPDNAYNGTFGSMASRTITVSGLPTSGAISNIQLKINIGHTWIGDMTIKLVAPGGQVLALASRPGMVETADDGSGCCGALNNMVIGNTITFDDAGATTSEDWGSAGDPVPAGTYAPSNGAIASPPAYTTFAALAAAVGIANLNGTWTIYFGDSGAGDTGSFSSEQLVFTLGTTPPGGGGNDSICELICPGDIYYTLSPGECNYTVTYPLGVTAPCVINPAPVPNFVGDFAPANGENTTDLIPPYPYTGSFGGNTTLTLPSSDGSNGGQTYFQAFLWSNLPTAGTISYNWSWSTNDGPFFDNSGYLHNVPGTMQWFNGQNTTAYGCYQLTDDFGGLNQSGSSSVLINAGDNFGFYSYTVDGAFGPGTLVVSNFSFQATPTLPAFVQTAGVNIGFEADFSGGLIDYITETFPVGTTTVTYTGVGADGNPVECSFDVVVYPYPNPVTSMVCNDLVNVSLDPENCTAVLNADMILEGGPYGCYDDYEVALGTSMAGPFNLGNTVTCANIGQTLAVQVTAPNGNRCWGWVKIEDKIPPTVDCDECQQEVNELTGRLQYGVDPVASWLTGNACWNFTGWIGPYPGDHPYDLVNFTVPVSGSYVFDLHTDADLYPLQGYLGVFNGFTPGQPCDNLIGGVDEVNENFTGVHSTVTLNLTAGVEYQFVLIDYGITSDNNYDWVVNATGPGGVGIIATVPCEIACSEIDALLNATTVADLEELGIETSAPAATDNCALQGCPDLTYTFEVGALSSTELCDADRYIPITWTVTDLGGNSV